jgi:hypothetical protein
MCTALRAPPGAATSQAATARRHLLYCPLSRPPPARRAPPAAPRRARAAPHPPKHLSARAPNTPCKPAGARRYGMHQREQGPRAMSARSPGAWSTPQSRQAGGRRRQRWRRGADGARYAVSARSAYLIGAASYAPEAAGRPSEDAATAPPASPVRLRPPSGRERHHAGVPKRHAPARCAPPPRRAGRAPTPRYAPRRAAARRDRRRSRARRGPAKAQARRHHRRHARLRVRARARAARRGRRRHALRPRRRAACGGAHRAAGRVSRGRRRGGARGREPARRRGSAGAARGGGDGRR